MLVGSLQMYEPIADGLSLFIHIYIYIYMNYHKELELCNYIGGYVQNLQGEPEFGGVRIGQIRGTVLARSRFLSCPPVAQVSPTRHLPPSWVCLLYTSDAADETDGV